MGPGERKGQEISFKYKSGYDPFLTFAHPTPAMFPAPILLLAKHLSCRVWAAKNLDAYRLKLNSLHRKNKITWHQALEAEYPPAASHPLPQLPGPSSAKEQAPHLGSSGILDCPLGWTTQSHPKARHRKTWPADSRCSSHACDFKILPTSIICSQCRCQHKKTQKLQNGITVITQRAIWGRQMLVACSHVLHRLPCWTISYLSESAFLFLSLCRNNWFHLGAQEYRERKKHVVMLALGAFRPSRIDQ